MAVLTNIATREHQPSRYSSKPVHTRRFLVGCTFAQPALLQVIHFGFSFLHFPCQYKLCFFLCQSLGHLDRHRSDFLIIFVVLWNRANATRIYVRRRCIGIVFINIFRFFLVPKCIACSIKSPPVPHAYHRKLCDYPLIVKILEFRKFVVEPDGWSVFSVGILFQEHLLVV